MSDRPCLPEFWITFYDVAWKPVFKWHQIHYSCEKMNIFLNSGCLNGRCSHPQHCQTGGYSGKGHPTCNGAPKRHGCIEWKSRIDASFPAEELLAPGWAGSGFLRQYCSAAAFAFLFICVSELTGNFCPRNWIFASPCFIAAFEMLLVMLFGRRISAEISVLYASARGVLLD